MPSQVEELNYGGKYLIVGGLEVLGPLVGPTFSKILTAIELIPRASLFCRSLLLCTTAATARTKLELGSTDVPTFAGLIVPYVKAASAAGLQLQDDAGNLGVFVEDGGNVGIGTPNPGYALHVVSAGSPDVAIEGAAAGNSAGVIFKAGGAALWQIGKGIGTGDSDFHFFDFSGTPGTRIVVKSITGNLGVGTLDPMMIVRLAVAFAKTDTTNRECLFIGSNEAAASNPFGLDIYVTGAAAMANRKVQFQTTDYGLAAGGSLIFQPDAGNVGVGIVPATTLHVDANAASAEVLRLQSSSGTVTQTFHIDAGLVALIKAINPGNHLAFEANGIEVMRLLGTGRVGVKTTTPATELDVNGQITQSTNVIRAVFTKALTDGVATAVFTISTTNETGDADGGTYSCHVRGTISNGSTPTSTNSATKAFQATFGRAMLAASTGVSSAVSEVVESASAATDAAQRDVGAMTMTVTETSEYVINVLITAVHSGASAAALVAMLSVELIWHGFTTAPVLAQA